MADPYVREVGRIDTMDGALLPVLVDYDSVLVGPFRLDASMAEEFAQLFVSAVWQAGQQKARMDAEVVDAEIWCAGNCAKGPALHLATETCRVPEPEVAPDA